MHVWMLIWSYWPASQGGAERQCRLISPYLVDRGIHLTVVTARLSFLSKAVEKDGTVPVNRIGLLVPLMFLIPNFVGSVIRFFGGSKDRSGKPLNVWSDELIFKVRFWSSLPFVWLGRLFFMQAFAVKVFRNRKSLDLIHVHETGWLGALAVFLGSMLHIPVVCKEATYPPFPVIGWDVPLSWYLRRVQRNAFYIALNNQVRDEIIDQGCAAERVSVVPNAVRLPTQKAVPEQSKILLYVGNFSQGAFLKGFDVLFTAWAEAVLLIPDCRLVLAGAGENTTWKARVRELGCEASVEFLGFVNEPATLYQDAALLVLPSRVEGMSNALLEALSWGVPVLVSDIPGNRAVVREGRNGMLVPSGDAAALAVAMIHLMQSPGLRTQMGEYGRAMAENDFHADTVSSQLVSLYKRLSKQTMST